MVGVEAPVAPLDAVPRLVVVGGLVDLERDEGAVQSYGIEFALDELAGDAVEERVERREAVEEREHAALGEDARQRPKKLAHVLVALGVRVEEDRVVSVASMACSTRPHAGAATVEVCKTSAGHARRRRARTRLIPSTMPARGPRRKVTPAHFSGNASTRFSTSGCGSITQCAAIRDE